MASSFLDTSLPFASRHSFDFPRTLPHHRDPPSDRQTRLLHIEIFYKYHPSTYPAISCPTTAIPTLEHLSSTSPARLTSLCDIPQCIYLTLCYTRNQERCIFTAQRFGTKTRCEGRRPSATASESIAALQETGCLNVTDVLYEPIPGRALPPAN